MERGVVSIGRARATTRTTVVVGLVVATVAAALGLAVSGPPPAVGAASAPGPSQLVVGSQTLGRCQVVPLTYCGRLSVPLTGPIRDPPTSPSPTGGTRRPDPTVRRRAP